MLLIVRTHVFERGVAWVVWQVGFNLEFALINNLCFVNTSFSVWTLFFG